MTEPRDEKHTPDEPDATTEPIPEPAETEPPAAEQTPEQTPEPPAPTGGQDRVAVALRSRWLPPLATGLAGLLLGLMIGAVGMGLIAGVLLHHGPRGHHGPRDFHGPGNHWQDERPVPPRR